MEQKPISVEKELALILSQIAPNDKVQSRAFYLINKSINWKYFINFCQREGVAGLVWRNLNVYDQLNVDIQNSIIPLKNTYKNIIHSNLRLLHSFEYVLKKFEEKEIPIILLQGIALLEMIYQDLGLRTLGDIDLLVKDEHIEKLRDLLLAMGFENIKNYPSLYSGDGILLDVHIDIANLARIQSRSYALAINSETLWKDSRAINGSQSLIRLLSLEDMILTLCAHLQKHSYDRIIWFVDINEILRKYKDDIDWERLISRANKFRLMKPLYFVLEFINHHWSPLDGILCFPQLHDSHLNFIQKKALKKIINLKKIDKWGDILYFFEIKSKRHKIYFMLETCFPRPKVMAQIFNIANPVLIFLAYPLRLWQLTLFVIKSFFNWLFTSLFKFS